MNLGGSRMGLWYMREAGTKRGREKRCDGTLSKNAFYGRI